MTKVDTKLLLNFVRNISTMSKHGEPEEADPEYIQNWEEDCGSYAIERLHSIIDDARDLLKSLELS